MILAGEQSTFPKLLFISNRMKIERLIEEGLLQGGSGKADMDRIHRGSNHMHGQAMRTSAETETEDQSDSRVLSRVDRRSSLLQEIRRQSNVFLDDVGVEDEESGESEDDRMVNNHGEHRKVV